MRYIIDRKTKEHERYDGQNYDATKYRMVEADSEGWIAHTGDVCPLPDDVNCDIRYGDGKASSFAAQAENWAWDSRSITHYRPILEESVQEDQSNPVDRSEQEELKLLESSEIGTIKIQDTVSRFNLLDRLKAAHKTAQQIPDLEAELREVLEGMGYDLVTRSPFVSAEFVEPEAVRYRVTY